MNRKLILWGLLALNAMPTFARKTLTVRVVNPSRLEKTDEPVIIDLHQYGEVDSATVTFQGQQQPYQLDDLNHDCKYDELCFLTNLQKGQEKTYQVNLFDHGTPETFKARTYAELVVPSKNKKLAKNQQDIYLRCLSFDKKTKDIYHFVHSHGLCFESELIALRVYFDNRQTVDVYGKKHKQLELFDTQFYPSAAQLAQGYGDDDLWVGDTYGLGALRGWDGHQERLFDHVGYQEQRVVAEGPLRAIVEVVDNGWVPAPGMKRVNATIRYTIYAGHRDVDVDVFFDRNAEDEHFATGLINVKNSTEFSDQKGLRGCYGTDWPTGKDDGVHHLETVGLGIYIPEQYLRREVPATLKDYTDVVKPVGNSLHYKIACTSKKEDFGFKDGKAWFTWLKDWKQQNLNPITVTIE
ncbi:MAG: DUF4861 domain-containing protein [Prevotella sp.]|jgi:hypothetical protein|nr:DUF4861 domain-containing protein [Prevotella sp.]